MEVSEKNRVDEFIKNPKRALFVLAIPMIVAFLFQSFYNIIDTIFVGRLGPSAIAAVTLCFPLFFILNSFAFGIGIGITSLVGKRVGEKRKTGAENAACHGIFLSTALSVLFLIFGHIFVKQIFSVFDADPEVVSMGIDYMKIIFSFLPVFFLGNALYSIMSGEGDTKTPMAIKIGSVILNIILDPIFIYVLDMGVKGAALATGISETVGIIVFSYLFFIKNSGYLKVDFRLFSYRQEIINHILKVGTPVTLTQLIMSFGITLLNIVMAIFGTLHLASFGLVARLDSFVVMPILGISGALVALVSMFRGAKRPDLIRTISWYGIKISVLFALCIGLIFFIFPNYILRLFTDDPELLEIGVVFLRLFVFNYPMMAVGINVGRIIQGLGLGIPGLIITSIRVLLVAIPLAYVFVFVLGYGFISVLVAMLISSLVSTVLAILMLKHFLNKKDLIN